MKTTHHSVFRLLQTPVGGESWKSFLSLVLGVWLAVWLYAAIHNQYLIRIEPEHFTVWHYGIPFVKNLTLLGIAYAAAASLSPGVVLGMCLFVVGRLGTQPKLSIRFLILSTTLVWLGVEICAAAIGLFVWKTHRRVYPEEMYPTNDLGLMITQSIQITAYLTGALFSVFLLFYIWWKRKSSKKH